MVFTVVIHVSFRLFTQDVRTGYRHLNETAQGAGRILPAPAYEIGTDL